MQLSPTRLLLVLVCFLPAFGQHITSSVSIDSLMEANHWKRARHVSEERIRINPADAQAHYYLSKIKGSFGELDGAVAEAEKAVSLERHNPDFHGQLAEAYAQMADRSTILKGLGYVRRMKREIDAALALNPKHTDTLLVAMMFAWKAPALAGGDKKKAREIADRLVATSPVWGYLAEARLAQETGADAAIEAALAKAISLDGSFYRARNSLALFYCCTSSHPRWDAAEKAAHETMRVDPTAAGSYDVLARVYAHEQRWADLEALLAQAEHAVPDDLQPYYEAALALSQIGLDFRRAERYINRYLSQPAEGRAPTHAQARWLMASMYEREGRKEDAMRELQAAVQLQPDFEQAKRDLKRLRQS